MLPTSSDELTTKLKKIADGSFAAMILAPASNAVEPHNIRGIIRKINTPGGPQLALHEVSSTTTSAGMYGNLEDIVAGAARMEQRIMGSRLYEMLESYKTLRWTFAQEADLPPNLHPV